MIYFQVKDLYLDGHIEEQSVQDDLGPHISNLMKLNYINSIESKDLQIWKLTSEGHVSIKSAWELRFKCVVSNVFPLI